MATLYPHPGRPATVDLTVPSRRIGEFQHAAPEADLTALGHVLAGVATGRRNAEEITVFDSSGLSLQDLYIADAVIKTQFATQREAP